MCSNALASHILAQHVTAKDAKKDAYQKRLSLDEFRTAFGCEYGGLSASIRYGSLSVSGDVLVRFDAVAGAMKITGKYGL
jgi:hypothetical protein